MSCSKFGSLAARRRRSPCQGQFHHLQCLGLLPSDALIAECIAEGFQHTLQRRRRHRRFERGRRVWDRSTSPSNKSPQAQCQQENLPWDVQDIVYLSTTPQRRRGERTGWKRPRAVGILMGVVAAIYHWPKFKECTPAQGKTSNQRPSSTRSSPKSLTPASQKPAV